MTSATAFGPIDARNALAGNQFSGPTTINFEDQSSQQLPRAYRAIHFPHNDDFVPRSSIREQIEKLIPPKTEYQSAALWGLGGSGKTQLALDYAYRRCSDPACSVFWVHADSETSFAQDYKWIARKLGLPESLNGEELLVSVRNQVEMLPQWVFVLDNADNLSLFGVGAVTDGAPDLSAYVPRGHVGTVLWTSRDKRIAGSLVSAHRGINVARMTDCEAETLLRTVVVRPRYVEQNDIARLVAELDWLPLAISQAATYIRRTTLSIAEYLQRIQERKRRWKVLERSEHDRHRRPQASNSVLGAWNISIEYIKQENQTAYDILTALAYVDNQNIPFEMMARIAQLRIQRDLESNGFQKSPADAISIGSIGDGASEDEGENESKYEEVQEKVFEAVVRLEEFSFLTLQMSGVYSEDLAQRTYNMHKLVQEAISYRLYMRRNNISEESTSAAIAFEAIDSLFPTEWQRETWEQCEKYLGHSQRAGEWAQAHNGEEDVSRLLVRASNYLNNRGRWREREPVNLLLLRLRIHALGRMHPDTIDSMSDLAATYHALGRSNEAEKLHLYILGLRRDVQGDKHPKTIESMSDLAATYFLQGRFDEAEKLLMDVLELRRDLRGGRHPETTQTLSYLAGTYYEQGRYEEAENTYKNVLEIQRDDLGDKHFETIRSMAKLATTYRIQGRHNEAEKLMTEVIDLERDLLGENHPLTIDSMVSLGTVYFVQRRDTEAEKMYTKALELQRDMLGDRHPETIKSRAYVAATYDRQGRHNEAEKIHNDVLGLLRDVLGDKHPDTIRSMVYLASTYNGQGRYGESEKILTIVLGLSRDVLGDKHPDTIASMEHLATTYDLQGKHDEADRIARDVLELRRSVLGHQHP